MESSGTIIYSKSHKKDLYFTKDHEWIDFQDSVAYMGICSFKLKGIKSIEKYEFAEAGIQLQANHVIGSIYYADYKIDIHIPVKGRILSFNEALLKDNPDVLLNQSDNSGWVALIAPDSPYDRRGLILAEQYRLKTLSPW